MWFAALVFLAALPIFAVISLWIFLDDGGPIFFHQKRMGHQKKPFVLWKFRTMKHGADGTKKKLLAANEAPSPMFKIGNDPRYTRVGKFLSRVGFDELPQLWNILKGEMSLVGPRPLPIEEAQTLPKTWDFRYIVKPGIISEWAISPLRYQSLKKWSYLEKDTLRQGSWRYDLELFWRTIQYIL